MQNEKERIERLLAEGKISPEEARKLFDVLEGEPRKKREAPVPGKRRPLLIYLVPGVLLVIAVLLLQSRHDGSYKSGENLLLNPGFEKGAASKVASWTPSVAAVTFLGSAETERAVLVRSGEVAHNGKYSVSIINNSTENRITLSWRQHLKTFPRGRKLRLQGFLKTEDVAPDGAVSLVLRGRRGLKEETFVATTAMSYDLTGTHDWQKVQLQVMVLSDTEELQVLCQLEGRGAIWCDDLELAVVD